MGIKLLIWKLSLLLLVAIIIVFVNKYTRNSLQNSSVYRFDEHSHSGVASPDSVKSDLFNNLPELTLFVRTTFSKPDLRQLAICEFFRTAALYWSRKLGPVLFLLDENSSMDHVYGKMLLEHQDALRQDITVRYEPIPQDNNILHMSSMPIGYNIQLYSSFFIDLYVDSEVVAWTDTDAAFTTPVTTENIINNGKLVVKGIPAFERNHEKSWSASVEMITGYRFVTNFMTYFPVFLWKDTIKNCREFIIRRHNTSLADVLEKATRNSGFNLSPVCVILTYAYYFERQRYDWHIDPQNNLTAYNKRHVAPGFELRPEDTKPEVHLTMHSKHCKSRRKFNYFLNTYCPLTSHVNITLPDRVASLCKRYEHEWPKALFMFENKFSDQKEISHLQNWCRDSGGDQCKEAARNHFENVKRYVQNGVYDLDLTRTVIVEGATRVFGGQCEQLY